MVSRTRNSLEGRTTSGGNAERSLTPSLGQRGRKARAEERRVARVVARCHALILEACSRSSVPPEFLGALAASESGGDARAARFEPAVYRHLKSVASGESARYGGIGAEGLGTEIEDMLHPKAGDYHARFLIAPFDANHRRELVALEDDAVRELATSWGYTQIMGYHMVGRSGTVRELLEPHFHFRLALELLAEFAADYQLDLRQEFAEMFRCWNTGQPYGKTYDPDYVENGLRRISLYRQMAAAVTTEASDSAKDKFHS